MNNILKKYFIIILGFYTFWIFGIPFIFSKAVPVVCENLTYNSEYNVIVKNPKLILSPLPFAIIKADEFDVMTKNGDDAAKILSPNIRVRLFPLLSLKLHINKISAKDVYLNTKISEKPVLDKDFVEKLLKTKNQLDAIKVENFKVELSQNNTGIPALYSGNSLHYRKNGRYIKVNVDSVLDVQGKVSEIKAGLFLPKNNDIKKSKVDVKVSNVDIAPIGDYLKNYLPNDIVDIRGIVDVNVDKNHLSGLFKNCAILANDSSKSIILPEILEINSDFSITRKLINIKNALINSQNIKVDLNGVVENYLDKTSPDVNLNIRIDNSKVEDFISMLPPIRTEDIDIYKLKKYKFYGDIIGNLNIKGHNLEPNITGNVFINNGILTKPIPNAKGATVKLKFLGRYLNYDVSVPASLTEKVWVKGGVELYNVKYADMRVWSTQKVDLATAEEKVVPIHEILNFVIGPVPIMDIKGDGNIDITVKGNRKSPHIWGSFNLNNVRTHFIDMPDFVMYDADANLTFDDENITFNLKKGFVNNKPIKIDGKCNVSGKLDFDVSSENQEIAYLYKAIQNSGELINDIKKMLPEFDKISGPINFLLKITGNIKYIEDLKFNENLFANGKIILLGNTFGMNGAEISSAKGQINFDGTNADLDINSKVYGSDISIKAGVKNNVADLAFNAPTLNLQSLVQNTDSKTKELSDVLVNISAKYKGMIDKIEYDKLDFVLNILGSGKNNRLKLSNGKIELRNGKLSVKDLSGTFKDTKSSFDVNITADNLQSKPIYNGQINLNNFELPILNDISGYSLLPEDIRYLSKQIKFDKGNINLKSNIRGNNINASSDLGGISFTYVPLNIPIKIINGSIYTRKNNLNLNKINLTAEGMPLLVDGVINNFILKPEFDIYINSKPKQEYVDKYINKDLIYPLKIKGDIVFGAKIKGTKDNYELSSDINIAKDSSIYYMGATLGDVENALHINLDTDIIKNSMLKIKDFSYDKIIDSQGTRQTCLSMLKANGGIDILKDDLLFREFRVKTQKPTDARIFNIIFKKPHIKQGQFTTDLKLNGKLSNPKILGTFHIYETNIPFMDTTMKNITMIFKDKTIDVSSFGEVLGNDINFKGVLKNKLTIPYYVESAELYTNILDLNYITNKIKMSQVEEHGSFESLEGFNLYNVIIKNLKMSANSIKLRNIAAENVEAVASLNEQHKLSIEKFKFDIANGYLDGNFAYNLANSATSLNMKAKNINANDISYAIFDLKNQIFGDLTGDAKLSCTGSDFQRCMETLNGSASFAVSDGRMPKLGSLEYLLKAGNLIKGGLTGLSINSVIDIITPLKTGNFSAINGSFTIKDGVAEKVDITTEGKDLNLFITGKYNFATSIADMEVFGLLSKKISTMFGPIGNVSINTLFNVIPGIDLTKDSIVLDGINKIPGIELSSKSFRKFVAEIKGNINSDNYVRSFRWIN